MARRGLPWVLALAAAVQGLGMARTLLPAQDGLKFIQVARRFQAEPWTIVIRETDRHPLYPATIALAQPIVRLFAGDGPASWRIAAQGVSALAAIAILVPLFFIARRLFNDSVALVAVALYALLPLPAELGHDTLSDSLALCFFATSFWLALETLRSQRVELAIGCGVAAGLGYLTRPEMVILPAAIALSGLLLVRHIGAHRLALLRLGTVGLTFLGLLGCYALVKGDVSEKLALRMGNPYVVRDVPQRQETHSLPKGLDDPHWDFSAKEESDDPAHLSAPQAASRLVFGWAEGLGWLFLPLALWGALRVPSDAESRSGRRLAAIYIAIFCAGLIYHAMRLGYLSGRHTLTLVIVALPWAAAGAIDVALRFGRWRGWSAERRPRRLAITFGLFILLGLAIQAKAGHPSRWGHWAAGDWLRSHSKPTDAVLDTRGWAAFLSGRPSYDYWHVRQALSDAKLAYIVVGNDELNASSRRAETLRAVLAYAAEPVAAFPERKGGQQAGIVVYRFHRPDSWEQIQPCP